MSVDLLARALDNSAGLSAFRGNYLAALNDYNEVLRLLWPLVLKSTGVPRRDDGERLFEAALQPVLYFLKAGKFDRAQQYLPNLSLIIERLVASDPYDPDYLRWRATYLLQTAYVALGVGSQQDAGAALQGYVESLREVHRIVRNPTSRRELATALERAEQISRSIGGSFVPLTTWRKQASELEQEVNIPAGWRLLTLDDSVTFAVPPDAHAENVVQPIDSKLGILRGSFYEVIYDYGRSGESLADNKGKPEYNMRRRTIDRRDVTEVSFKSDGKPWGVVRMLQVRNGANVLTIRVSCIDQDTCNMAADLFNSLRFTSR